MSKNILSLCIGFVVLFTTITTNAVSQKVNKIEQGDSPGETVTINWRASLENVRVNYSVSQADFTTFKLFEFDTLAILQRAFCAGTKNEDLTTSTLSEAVKENEKTVGLLYERFQNIKKLYPSSVAEHQHPGFTPPPCDPLGCDNIDFSTGNLSGWYGYYADNTGNPISAASFVGGACGAVTESANDPTSEAYMTTRADCSPKLTLSNDYQISITHSGNDFVVPSIPRVSPFSTTGYSVMLGDSQMVGRGAALLAKTFSVTAATANLTYQYALLLENPITIPIHTPAEKPFFTVFVLDAAGDTIPNCGVYSVTSGYGIKGFDSLNYAGDCSLTSETYYRPWSQVNVPLGRYIGQCVTIEFEIADCSQGGHFGYAYVDASCSPAAVLSSSPAFCGDENITLTGPSGSASYSWTGPLNHEGGDTTYTGIIGSSTTQTVTIDSSGVYQLITIPVTGATCADTLYDTIKRLPNSTIVAQFHADTVCVGDSTRFINTSSPGSGAFYWDFYNSGTYEYSNVTNDTVYWTYPSAGTYTVKLNELSGGCGKDTLITVVVNPAVGIPTHTATPLCLGDSTLFTTTATGATTYNWNFGNPASGALNTSALQNTGHIFTSAGTYTVGVTASVPGGCAPTSTTFTVTIDTLPRPKISGDTNICINTTTTLSATGGGAGATYVWSTGATAASISPTVSVSLVTYTVTATNSNGCVHDTTIRVHTYPVPIASISPTPDTICAGQDITLFGSGAGVYKWSNGGTGTSIAVSPTISTRYYLRDSIQGSLCLDTTSVLVFVRPALVASIGTNPPICPGPSVTIPTTISSGGSVTYAWSPGGQTSSSIQASPDTTTTYTVIITGQHCSADTLTSTVTVVPLPGIKVHGFPWQCKGTKDTLTVASSTSPTTYLWSNGSTTTNYFGAHGGTGDIEADSTFYVTATNSLGCSVTDTFKVAVRDKPIVKTTSTPFCAGSSVTFTASASGGTAPYTYTWSTGQTGTTITVDPGPTTDTTYTITVTDGCPTVAGVAAYPDIPALTACCNTTIIVGDTATIGTSGSVIHYLWSPTTSIVGCDTCMTAVTDPTVTTTYTVTGLDAEGCPAISYVTIIVDIPCFNPTIPNVFTPTIPGPDGVNSEFYIKTQNIDAWSISIFDRWGKVMFTTTNQYQYWDGNTEGGGKAPSGVYYYIINATCQSTSYKKDGYLQLIR